MDQNLLQQPHRHCGDSRNFGEHLPGSIRYRQAGRYSVVAQAAPAIINEMDLTSDEQYAEAEASRTWPFA